MRVSAASDLARQNSGATERSYGSAFGFGDSATCFRSIESLVETNSDQTENVGPPVGAHRKVTTAPSIARNRRWEL
jgi:hypothetical protein